jgi:polysaccharide pyruvyl transferase WcaK-like protein
MNAATSRVVDGLHVHPGRWFFPSWRNQEFGLGLEPRKIYASACSLLRNGLNLVMPQWIRILPRPVRTMAGHMKRIRAASPSTDNDRAISTILNCDYLIAGHDGALNEYVCQVVDMMRSQGMRFGVFGSTMRPRVNNPVIIGIFANTLQYADFIYCRDHIATEWAQRHFPKLSTELAPDPAFGMKPAPPERVRDIIARENLEDFFEHPVVMVTPAEPSPIARHCFQDVNTPAAKLACHRELLSSLIRHIVETTGANVLLLPHAFGPGLDLDDSLIARDLLARCGLPADRALMLRGEYNARELKGLIARADLLVAERIHSIIGAVGVHTPFLCLGSGTDFRVTDIVAKMLECADVVYTMSKPSTPELTARFDDAWHRREELAKRLVTVSARLRNRLEEAAERMRPFIDDTLAHSSSVLAR